MYSRLKGWMGVGPNSVRPKKTGIAFDPKKEQE